MEKFVTGIDVGTYQVKVVIAERPEHGRDLPHIIGTGYAESRGMKQGYLVSSGEAARSIAAAVAQASKAARVRVKSAYLGIGGIGLEEAFARGETVVERGDSEITARDLARAEAAAQASLPPVAIQNRKIIHAIPLRYTVDGARVLGRSPVGMQGMRLAVEMLYITCLKQHIDDLVAAVEEAGIEVEDIIASPLAASFVALTKTQKRLGCVLANIGAETLSVIVFEDSTPISVKIFPAGAADITNDLALALRLAPEEAEQLKYGAVLSDAGPRKKTEDIIARRVNDLFKLVDAHLKKIGKDELLPAGIILTGGGSAVHTAVDLARAVLRLPARQASLDQNNQQLQLKDSSWAVAYGLTIWGFNQGREYDLHADHSLSGSFHDLWKRFKKFLP